MIGALTKEVAVGDPVAHSPHRCTLIAEKLVSDVWVESVEDFQAG